MVLLFVVMSGGMFGLKGDSGKPTAAEPGNRAGLSGDLNLDDSVDVHAVEKFASVVRLLVYAEDFDKLEQIADSVRGNKAKFSGGLWKIHAFYFGSATIDGHATDEDWQEMIHKLTAWVSAKPGSIAARISLASLYLDYAWDARGDGYANTVTSNGWKLFESRTAKAREILEEAAKLPTKDPEWYLAMQQVALAQDWDKAEAKALLERAVAFEPDYYYYYRMYARFILPKWNGEPGEAESFAKESADRVGGVKGDILYFRIASDLMCHCDDEQQLKNLEFSRIRRGFACAEALYGFSLTNTNLMAAMAAKVGEASIANAQFQRIGESWSSEAFWSRAYFEYVKEWAANLGPGLQSITDSKDAGEANMATPEGQRFDAEFRQKYASVIRMCFQSSDPTLGKSDLFVGIGKDGKMEKMMAFGKNPSGACLYQLANKSLTPPSHSLFWIKLTFDPVQLQ